jgi:hypothetical protein
MPKREYTKVSKEHEAYIDSQLTYNPITGLLWWTCRGSNSRKTDRPAGYAIGSGHLSIRLCPAGQKDVSVLVHRLVWRIYYGTWPDGDLDHINGDRKDNRISNLRIANPSENCANSAVYKNNTTGYKGVHKLPCGRFKSRIQYYGKRKTLGIFETAEEAYEEYLKESRKIHGDFSRYG